MQHRGIVASKVFEKLAAMVRTDEGLVLSLVLVASSDRWPSEFGLGLSDVGNFFRILSFRHGLGG